MRKMIDAEVRFNSMKLRQMGGIVEEIKSKMCYVKFDVEGMRVSYVYNVNKRGNYFLERVKPYPAPIREYDEEDQIVDVIKTDLEQFKNASKSHNFNGFIEINKKMSETLKKFEDLFLYYNVPEEENRLIYNKLLEIEAEIEKTKRSVERVYHKKDPENLI